MVPHNRALAPAPSLQVTKRSGWVRKGVAGPESIADHMYRMGLMATLCAGASGVDVTRCIKMALVHDVAEAIVGDITPHCGVSVCAGRVGVAAVQCGA
jgi:putative hydrolase of HD superfamily